MPIYESEEVTRDKLYELRKKCSCQVCGGRLNVFLDEESRKAFLACWDWNRTQHDGIAKEYREPRELNIPTRREIMAEQFGDKGTALAKYIGTQVITRSVATEIVESLWGDAPPIEKTKAIILCHTYQLNPLMKHLHLVGYKRRDSKGEYIRDKQGNYVLDWSMMIGIGATRLMAQRKHHYSYIDLSPRLATQQEIDKILGDTADMTQLYGFCHIKDMDTGAEAFGLRGIGKNEKFKGEEKGNTRLNMACVRAERQCLDRQYPGEMPEGLEVIDERFMDDVDGRIVDTKTGEIIEGESRELPDETGIEPAIEQTASEPEQAELVQTDPSQPTLGDLQAVMTEHHWSTSQVEEFLKEVKKWNYTFFKELTSEQIGELMEHIQNNPK